MSRRSVQQLADGENLEETFLVTDKQLRTNRAGNPYLQIELRDRTGSISARMWNANDAHFRSFEAGDFLRIRGKVQLYQGSLQIIFVGFERVPTAQVPLEEFMPRCDQDIGQLLDRLRTLLRTVKDPHLRGLVECFLMDEQFLDGFCQAPAGIRNHHAYIGGLLEHVVTLLEIADRIAPLYPELNRDLLVLGIFLHDIGKVRELSYRRVFGYTDEGQLVGHIVQGIRLLDEKIAKTPELTGEPFPAELVLRLQHLVVSHHGSHEFGSPRVPMTPEAIALHHLDNFDAKLHAFLRDIRDDQGPGAWTPYSQSLGRRLFKGLREGNGVVDGPE